MNSKKLNLISLQDIHVYPSNRILIFLCLLLSFGISAQGVSDLKAKKEQLLEDIQITKTRLAKTKKNRAAAISSVSQLKSNIEKRTSLILTISDEINLLDSNQVASESQVDMLEEDLAQLKMEYAEMLRHANRQQAQDFSWMFILSSKSFNQAFKRWRYFKQYDAYRSRQVQLINETQEMLEENNVLLSHQREERFALLNQTEQQKLLLDQDLQSKKSIVANLKKTKPV